MITVHRGHLVFRVPILHVAAAVVGLGLALLCAGWQNVDLTW